MLFSTMKLFSDLFMIDFEDYLKELDQSCLHWTEIKAKGNIPSPRWGHSCVSYGEQLFVFGYKFMY